MMPSCEELEAERAYLENLKTTATTARDAAQQIIDDCNTALMYNYWNRYLMGCIPGGGGMSAGQEELAALVSQVGIDTKGKWTRQRFEELLASSPFLKPLIQHYMSEAV